jgi:hypothetical protein
MSAQLELFAAPVVSCTWWYAVNSGLSQYIDIDGGALWVLCGGAYVRAGGAA